MKIVRALCAILILAGLGMLLLALHGYRDQSRFVADAATASGEVVEVMQRVSSGIRGKTSTHYAYRVRFRTASGETVDADAMEISSSPHFIVGEQVALLHERANPRRVTFDHFAMLWADIVVQFIVAAVLLGSGGTAFWVAGGRRTGRPGRFEATLPEMRRAWREGRLTRDSEYQPLLIACAFVGFPLLGGLLAFLLFAPGVVQVSVGAILLGIAIQVIRDKRRRSAAPPQRR